MTARLLELVSVAIQFVIDRLDPRIWSGSDDDPWGR